MTTLTCTITKNGRSDEFGRALSNGQSYTGAFDFVRALYMAGYCSVSDDSVFDDDQWPNETAPGNVTAVQNPATGGIAFSVGGELYDVIGQVPEILANTGVPVIFAGSGTISAGGVVTLNAAIPTTYDMGAWVRFPAGAVSGGSAGLYWTVFSSTTQGQVYTNFHDPLSGFVPYIPTGPFTAAVGSGSAYATATATDTLMVAVPIAAMSMGKAGMLRFMPAYIGTNNANSKSYKFFMTGDQLDTNSVATGSASPMVTLRNKGSYSRQTYTYKDAFTALKTIDTSVDKQLRFYGSIASANDSLIMESLLVEVIASDDSALVSPPVLGLRNFSAYTDYVQANTAKSLLTLVMATDIHNGSDAIEHFAKVAKSAAPNYVINMGDVLQQTDVSDGTNAYLAARMAMDNLIVGCNTNYIGLMGNHEAMLASGYRDSVFRNVMTPKLDTDKAATLVWGDKAHTSLYSAGTRPYWYFDDSDFKVRFIHINPYYYTSATSAASNAELTWLANTACDFSAKGGDAANWKVVVLTHGALTGDYDDAGAGTNPRVSYSEPEKLFTALHGGTNYTNAGAGINKTFSPAVKVVAHFFGDLHNDVRYTNATLKYQDIGLMAGRGTADMVHANYRLQTITRSAYYYNADIIVLNLTDSQGRLFRVGEGSNFSWSW